ncbi:MAG: NADPH:quinone reductase [Anaerovoracaceae bacterium]|jgi:NADPH2:quinone reductase
MKAIVMREFGGPEVLHIEEVPEPSPGAGEVKVCMYACGVNPNETYVRSGTYNFYKPELPYTPGYDGAGIVEEVGEGVTHLKAGDRVFLATLLAKHSTGTYAEKIVCDADSVHHLPDDISFEEGASFGIPAMAAYRALFQRGQIKSGETALIHGADGGVGSLAVQMAKAAGAKVIGASNTPEGKELILSLGAEATIDYLTEENKGELMKLTDGSGPDLIVEFLANKNLQTDLDVIAEYGRIVVVGNRGTIEINPRSAMAKEADIRAMALWNARGNEYVESLKALEKMMMDGSIHAQVGKVLNLEEAALAHDLIISQHIPGKMILKIR